jgi:hypothetical protein
VTGLDIAAAISAALEQRRNFQDCLLREVRLVANGIRLELEFEYVWDDSEPGSWKIAETSPLLTLRLEPVHELRLIGKLPAGLYDHPESAGWGLSEVAIVELARQSELLEKYRSTIPVPVHHLEVRWDGGRRLDVVFSRFSVDENSNTADRP